MPDRTVFQLVGLATAVRAVVVRPRRPVVVDGAVPGQVFVGRGGMVCTTLAVASALGAAVGGVIANGDGPEGQVLRATVADEGVQAAFVRTARTPTTVTVAEGLARSSIMGVDGEREADLDPAAVAQAWAELDAGHVVWALLTLPALDSPAGQQFVYLARQSGANVAVTLSSAGHVAERIGRIQSVIGAVDLVFGNADEVAALPRDSIGRCPILETRGAAGAVVHWEGRAVAVPAPDAQVRDTTGAGDAFAAGALSSLPAATLDLATLADAARVGHRAAGIIISTLGAEVVGDVRDRLAKLNARQPRVARGASGV